MGNDRFNPRELPPFLESADVEDEEEQTVISQISVTPRGLGGKKQRRAYLIVLAGSQVGAVYRLSSRETTLGRSGRCEITISDTGISRKHAKITLVADDEVLVQDLGSTNGTFVADQRISSTVLRDGDRFQLGGTTLLKFSVSDEVEESFQRRLYESSVLDGLTGIHNRKHFDERLEAEFGFAQRHGTALGLILIDIDHFKSVNDTYGHQAGDEVLCSVAKAISGNTRAEDLVARYGGEEFAVIARGLSAEQTYHFADRIRQLIELLPITADRDTIHLTISAGVAAFGPGLFKDRDSLLAAADRALYEAKQTGRNRALIARECLASR